MSIYLEKARELGELILQSEQSISLADASAEFTKHPEAKQKLEEYNKYRNDVQLSIQNNLMTTEEVQKATSNLTQMATELKQDPIIGALVFAENEFNGFVNKVMDVLKYTITGQPLEEEGGCGSCQGCASEGNCSSCH